MNTTHMQFSQRPCVPDDTVYQSGGGAIEIPPNPLWVSTFTTMVIKKNQIYVVYYV
jgi:hypothetical protein